MASIEMRPDNELTGVWWLTWVEENEVIGKVTRDTAGRCWILPQGPHWSPMKSFAGQSFDTPERAVDEVCRYFKGR